MSELIKIKTVSTKYDISARTLRYYEEVGLCRMTFFKKNRGIS